MDFEKKIRELNKALESAKNISLYEEAINLYNAISYIYRTQGEWARCEETLKKATEYAQDHKQNESLGLLWSSLGAIYIEMGKLSNAENHLNKALVNLKDNHAKLASTYGNLGKACLYKGKWDLAVEHINKAIAEGEQSGQSASNLMSSYTTLARIESERGEFERAEEFFQIAEKHAQSLNFKIEITTEGIDYQEQPVRDVVHYCELLLARSNYMRYQGLIEEAIEYASDAVNYASSIAYSLGLCEAKLAIVKCNLAEKDITSAKNNMPDEASVQSPSQSASILLEEAIILSLQIEKEGTRSLIEKTKKLFSDAIERYHDLGHIYDERITSIKKDIYLSLIDESSNYALEIMNTLQEIRNMGIVSENVELMNEIGRYVRIRLNELDDKLTKAIPSEHDVFDKNDSTEYQQALVTALGVQNKLLRIGSDLSIIERISSLLASFAPNVDLQEEYELLNEQILCEIDICENNYKLSKNQTVLFDNKLREFKQKTDDKNNLLLQILQSVFSGIGISDIFISVINSFNIVFTPLTMLLLGEACVSWALLPLSVYYIANKDKKYYLFCFINGLLILISLIGLYHTIRHGIVVTAAPAD